MGSWNESCGVSNLPVTYGDKVRYMIIRKVSRHNSDHAVFYPFDIFQPVSVLIEGEYDDYGGLTTTEEGAAALFKSLTDCGVKWDETDRHGAFRVNDAEYSLPMDHYHWFLREDAFQMLNTLPLRDDTKTLAEAQKERLAKVMEIADKTVRMSAVYGSLVGMFSFWDAFGRLEMPTPPIFPILIENVSSSLRPIETTESIEEQLEAAEIAGEKPDLDAITAKFPPPDLSSIPVAAQPMLDFTRILYGMMTLRKMLHPMGGAGSQAWNDGAYEVYGEFVANAAREYRRMYDE